MAYWTNACYWGPALYFESHLASPSWLRRSTNASARTIYGTARDALRHLPSHADGRGFAIRQNVLDATPFEIADNRSITVPALPRPSSVATIAVSSAAHAHVRARPAATCPC